MSEAPPGQGQPIAPTPLVPVSWGELLDKISILEIKSARITGAVALANVRAELSQLNNVAAGILARRADVAAIKTALHHVNEALWDIEDRIRECEHAQDFGPVFIELARAVYRTNDERGALKRRINVLLGSALVEEKHYAAY